MAAMALTLLPVGLTAPANAVEPDEVLEDPVLEERAREISRELRCVVCQSQSIDDSEAPLAKDLRLLVRERIVAGDTNEEVIDYVAERYGDYVLLKPRVSGRTILLWATPVLALLLAAGAGAWYLFRQRPREKPQALTAEEQAALERMME